MERSAIANPQNPQLLKEGVPFRAESTPRALLHRWAPHANPIDLRGFLTRLDRARARSHAGACWIIRSGDSLYAYATMRLHDGSLVSAHRWIFALLHGPIPADRVVHHLCEQKRCANPDHLVLETISENVKHSHPRRRL